MTLLKDELMEATKLDEAKLKQKLIAKAPPPEENQTLQSALMANAVKKNTWAYITLLYAPSDCDIKDRMLRALK